MHIPKKYFHDRIVLMLLSTNVFLTVLNSMLILLRLDAGKAGGYTVEYRSNLGLSAFKIGGASTIISFIIFSALVLVLHTLLSMRVYSIRRHFSVTLLAMGTLLLLLSTIVSNALLVLR
jgi:hypothetical protein